MAKVQFSGKYEVLNGQRTTLGECLEEERSVGSNALSRREIFSSTIINFQKLFQICSVRRRIIEGIGLNIFGKSMKSFVSNDIYVIFLKQFANDY